MKTEIKFSHYDKQTKQFKFLITINGESFNYFQGIGHCELKRIDSGYIYLDLDKYTNQEKAEFARAKKPFGRLVVNDVEYLRGVFIKMPKIDDVLHCLFLDAECGQYSFSEFCDNLGYSNDSLNALDIYRACEESGRKLKRALKNEYYTEQQRIQALEL